MRSCVRPVDAAHMSAGPDGFRDPAPNKPAASKAIDRDGFSGSSVRPIVISFSSHTLASTRGPRCRRRRPLPRASSRPMPHGPSRCSITAEAARWFDRRNSHRSRSQIARNASAVAPSSSCPAARQPCRIFFLSWPARRRCRSALAARPRLSAAGVRIAGCRPRARRDSAPDVQRRSSRFHQLKVEAWSPLPNVT